MIRAEAHFGSAPWWLSLKCYLVQEMLDTGATEFGTSWKCTWDGCSEWKQTGIIYSSFISCQCLCSFCSWDFALHGAAEDNVLRRWFAYRQTCFFEISWPHRTCVEYFAWIHSIQRDIRPFMYSGERGPTCKGWRTTLSKHVMYSMVTPHQCHDTCSPLQLLPWLSFCFGEWSPPFSRPLPVNQSFGHEWKSAVCMAALEAFILTSLLQGKWKFSIATCSLVGPSETIQLISVKVEPGTTCFNSMQMLLEWEFNWRRNVKWEINSLSRVLCPLVIKCLRTAKKARCLDMHTANVPGTFVMRRTCRAPCICIVCTVWLWANGKALETACSSDSRLCPFTHK